MALLLLIYLIWFRADGGSIENAYRIMKGLNSSTFNYLQRHTKKLNITSRVTKF